MFITSYSNRNIPKLLLLSYQDIIYPSMYQIGHVTLSSAKLLIIFDTEIKWGCITDPTETIAI